MPNQARPAREQFITIAEAAQRAAVTTRTVHRAINAGDLAAYKVGRTRVTRIRLSDFDAWMTPMPALGRQR